MKSLILIVLVSLSACTGNYPPPGWGPYLVCKPEVNQEPATHLVWHEIYKQKGPPPPICWRYDHLDCAEGNGFVASNGECYSGVYVHNESGVLEKLSGHHIELAWQYWAWYLAETAFAHELCHAAFEDLDHEGPCGKGPDSVIPGANQELWNVPM